VEAPKAAAPLFSRKIKRSPILLLPVKICRRNNSPGTASAELAEILVVVGVVDAEIESIGAGVAEESQDRCTLVDDLNICSEMEV
jgi:hypothetical protein